jgi:hypothetical protein
MKLVVSEDCPRFDACNIVELVARVEVQPGRYNWQGVEQIGE